MTLTPERWREIEAIARVPTYAMSDAMIEAMAAIRDLLAEVPEWRPIETAPKDRPIDIWWTKWGKRVADASWWETGRCWIAGNKLLVPPEEASHYRELPKPPA